MVIFEGVGISLSAFLEGKKVKARLKEGDVGDVITRGTVAGWEAKYKCHSMVGEEDGTDA